MLYFDNSATTKTYAENLEIIKKYSIDNFYNPSALYSSAFAISKEIQQARNSILNMLGGVGGNLYFTASGTEADNLALFGSKKIKGSEIIISAIEHSAVMNSAKKLEQEGFKVTFAPVNKYGKVDIEHFTQLLNPNVGLISIMHVSNETGAINDIKALVNVTKQKCPKALFHSDGVQATGKMKVNLTGLGVDMYSLSAHKFHGLKGIGALYVKKGININPIIYGGGQEKGIRSATENVSGIMTTTFSLKKAINELNIEKNREIIKFIHDNILKIEKNAIINTNIEESVSHILSVALPFVKGEVLLHMLEDNGVIIGSGSACSARKGNKIVPTALNLNKDYENAMLRISIDSNTTLEDAKYFIVQFEKCYTQLKSIILGK